MANRIFNDILNNRGGHYVHAMEVKSTYEIESTISEIASAYRNYGIEALKEFFNSMDIYYIGNDTETENDVYDFNFDDYIDNNINL